MKTHPWGRCVRLGVSALMWPLPEPQPPQEASFRDSKRRDLSRSVPPRESSRHWPFTALGLALRVVLLA